MAVLAILVIAAPREAEAGDDSAGGWILIAPVEGLLTIGSLTAVIGTGVSLRDPTPSSGWRSASYAMAGLHITFASVSALWVYIGEADRVITVPFLINDIAFSAANFALAGVSSHMSGSRDVSWTPAPVAMRDRAGRVVPGVGIGGLF